VNLFLTIIITSLSITAGTVLCFWLLSKAKEVETTIWILQQLICPVFRFIVLLIVVSQVYPVIDENSSSLDFWHMLLQQDMFSDLINILFISSLLLVFIPVVNHPALTLTIQSCLTIALVYHWQYATFSATVVLFPSLVTIFKISAYMLFAYFIARESSIRIARWIDEMLVVSGSLRLVSDAIYLLLQIPVMLIYSSFLNSQSG
jgi:hypothetical protein